jgi:hypothetical protein
MAPARASVSAMAGTGLAGGFFSGLTGVGGGAVMVPLMTGVLRMRQHAAHGTSLVIIVFAAAAGGLTSVAREGAAWTLVATLLPASLVGAYAGARLVHHLPAMRLRQVFGAFVLVVGARLLLFAHVSPLFDAHGAEEALIGSLIGLTGGLISGALGVGGGAIFVPGMVLVLGTDQHQAQGASLLVIVGAAAMGAWTHSRHGSIDAGAVRVIAFAAVPAGVAGAYVASLLDGDVLQRVFAVVLVAVGVQMLASATLNLRRERSAPGAVPGIEPV